MVRLLGDIEATNAAPSRPRTRFTMLLRESERVFVESLAGEKESFVESPKRVVNAARKSN